jgi:thymidylate synthase
MEIINAQDLIKKEGSVATFAKAKEVARTYVEGLRNQGKISFSEHVDGNIPSVHIVRRNVPEAWEDIAMTLLAIGQDVRTGYDPKDKEGKFTSFPSVEATVMMHIQDPFTEPRFHQAFLGGWMGFGDYKAEIEGVKDHWMIDPKIVVELMKRGRFAEVKDDERWKYTYSQRFRSFPYIDIEGNPQIVNQLDGLIQKLVREPLSKSAQCITWNPVTDHNDGQLVSRIPFFRKTWNSLIGKKEIAQPLKWRDYDSPCLQRFWFRLIPYKDGYILNVNGDWRSRDHLKAVPQNIYGVTEGIHEHVRLALQNALGKPVLRGRYIDKSDSLHLYGHYFDQRKQGQDADAQLQTVFRIAAGEPIEKRLVLPGTPMHEIMMEQLQEEYLFRKNNPNAGKPEAKKYL